MGSVVNPHGPPPQQEKSTFSMLRAPPAPPLPPLHPPAPAPVEEAKSGAHGHTVQYLTLIVFSILFMLAVDRAFFGGTLTRPARLKGTIRRGAVAAVFQLRSDQVVMNAFADLDEMAKSATRWLAETTWMDRDLHSAQVREGIDGPDDGKGVAREPTPLTEIEVAVALREGHRMMFASEPNDFRLGVAWAHIALENGRGKETYNNNFGNIGATDSYDGQYYVRFLRERVQRNPDVWKYLRIKFRSYATPADGARSYWKVLQDHYGPALVHMDNGQAFEAAKKLNAAGYATALVEPYAMSIAKLYNEFQSRVVPELKAGATR
jgi:hypothetical protein